MDDRDTSDQVADEERVAVRATVHLRRFPAGAVKIIRPADDPYAARMLRDGILVPAKLGER